MAEYQCMCAEGFPERCPCREFDKPADRASLSDQTSRGDGMGLIAHWIAKAPAGSALSGPRVAWSEDTADEYRRMGWQVDGPFVLADDRGAVSANDDAFQVICDALSALHPPQARELMETPSYKAFAAFYKRGQSSPAGCPACSRVPGVARHAHTCSGEQS